MKKKQGHKVEITPKNIFTKKLTKPLLISVMVMLSLFIVTGISFLGILFYFHDRALPGVRIMGHSVGGMGRSEIRNTLEQVLATQTPLFVLETKEGNKNISWDEIAYQPDLDKTIENAIVWGKYLEHVSEIRHAFTNSINLPIHYDINSGRLIEIMVMTSKELEVEAYEPTIYVNDEGAVSVENGTIGQHVNEKAFYAAMSQLLAEPMQQSIPIPIEIIDKRVPETLLQIAQQRAELLRDKQLLLQEEDYTLTLKNERLVSLLAFDESQFNQQKVQDLVSEITGDINRPPQNAVFEFDESEGKVKEFKADAQGRAVEQATLTEMLTQSLAQLEQGATTSAELAIPIVATAAEVSVAQANDLGIHELIGRGESYFKGSIPSRVHNIEVAANRIHGALIAPGEVISFNQLVGEISRATGFQSAYVIQGGRTILGDGGGVCQVSSTLFRTGLLTGLPIEERKAHSYRVSYYEQQSHPGLDATIYSPSVDLKMKNDTPGHILIQTRLDKENYHLVIDFYGTSDGRVAEIDNFTLTGIGAPPEDLYIDDPTLPAGVVKQVEHKAWGAKASFDWKVTRGDEILQEKTFYSTFRPWQAVFMRGTGPAV